MAIHVDAVWYLQVPFPSLLVHYPMPPFIIKPLYPHIPHSFLNPARFIESTWDGQEIEPRYVPITPQRLVGDPQEIADLYVFLLLLLLPLLFLLLLPLLL